MVRHEHRSRFTPAAIARLTVHQPQQCRLYVGRNVKSSTACNADSM